MKPEDKGKGIVVIISEHRGETKTVKGTITVVFDEYRFEVEDSHGNKSVWNELSIKGYHWSD